MWLKTTKMKKYKKNAQYGGIAQIESDFANKTCGKSASKISCTNEVISMVTVCRVFFSHLFYSANFFSSAIAAAAAALFRQFIFHHPDHLNMHSMANMLLPWFPNPTHRRMDTELWR